MVPKGGAKAKQRSWGGHCVFVPKYDEHSFTCITWGGLKTMTVAFWKKYCDEAYTLLGEDWLNEKGAPSGFDEAQLKTIWAPSGSGFGNRIGPGVRLNLSGHPQGSPQGDLIPIGGSAAYGYIAGFRRYGRRGRFRSTLACLRARDVEQRAWETGVLPHSRGGNPKPMFLFRRLALLLALCLPAANVSLRKAPVRIPFRAN